MEEKNKKSNNIKQKSKNAANKSKEVITGNPVSKGLIFLVKAVISQWKVLLTITAIFIFFVLVLSCLTYGLEFISDGADFGVGDSIDIGESGELKFVDCFWWVYVTISTIGYGDIYPVTTLMRFWAIIISLFGMSFIALYTAVVVNGFTKQLQKNKESNNIVNELEIKEEELSDIVESLKNENKKLKETIAKLNKK